MPCNGRARLALRSEGMALECVVSYSIDNKPRVHDFTATILYMHNTLSPQRALYFPTPHRMQNTPRAHATAPHFRNTIE